jgi:uncharacterized protein with ParB-like and HNH nuclease domain
MSTEQQTKERPVHRITGAEHPLKKIFSDEFDFIIPPYQRPYSWTTEHSGELYDDLLNFMQDSKTNKEDDPYFLGSIVLIKREGDPRAEVIDGQQRLTTLTILFAAILEKLTGQQRDAVAKYINEPGDPAEDLEAKPRLALRERDREFFRKYIQTEGKLEKLIEKNPEELTDPRKNMVLNAKLFVERLEDIDAAKAFELAKFIVNRCFLVAVATPSMHSAFRIFTVLNDRGMDLLATDILKSDIIGTISGDDQDAYTEKWEETEDELGRDGFNELFAHIRMTRLRAKPQKMLLDDFRKLVIEKSKDRKKLIDDVIVPYAETYDTIRKAAYEGAHKAEKINRLLRWLARIDNVDWVPAALIYLQKNREDGEAIYKFLKALERLAASMFIRRCDINTRIERYARLMDAIDEDTVWDEDSPLSLSKTEKRDTKQALDGEVYNVNHNVRSYVLLRLDGLVGDAAASYDHKVITVEHVLPQTVDPNSEWATTWPEEEVRAQWVHRLGNLLLLSRRKNSEAQNYDFAKKKEKYFKGKNGVSTFAITTGVLKEDEWTQEIVEQRQEEMTTKLNDVWDL